MEETARQREEEFRSLVQQLTTQLQVKEKMNEDILSLKQLLRERDALLAKETQKKENLQENLMTKRQERDERAKEEEARLKEQKKREEELKKREQKRREQEEANKKAAAQKQAEKEAKRREEAKRAEAAAKKRQEENAKKSNKANYQEDSNDNWMAFIKSTSEPVTVKTEKQDDYPSIPPAVPSAPTNERNKFFKSRNTDPKRHLTFAPHRSKKQKVMHLYSPKYFLIFE